MTITVERSNSPGDLLHRLVRRGWPELQATLEAAGRSLPRHVEREMERFLRCGDPTEGFAWLECHDCDHHLLVPFSCKTRGFCPSCGGRRMCERADRWVDELLPGVAVRQWVLTIPWARRWLLARKPALARGVRKVAMKEIQSWMRKSLSKPEGRGGHVTVIQLFGSALSLNLHFHALVLDGLYVPDPRTGGIKWVRSPSLTQEAVEKLVVQIAERAEAFLAREGFAPEENLDDDDSEDATGVIAAAAVAGRSAVSGGKRARRVQRLGGREYKLPRLCANFEGYNLHAGVVIPARDREGLRRLCRYIARPPLWSVTRRRTGCRRPQLAMFASS